MKPLHLRSLARGVGVLAVGLAAAAPASAEPSRPVVRPVTSQQASQTSFVANRWLYAVSPKLRSDGWLEVRTSFEPRRGLEHRVMAEGGSERIRKRALYAVLKAEERFVAEGQSSRMAFTASNYVITPMAADGGERRVRLEPRRRDEALIDGEAVMDEHGCVKRVQGRLAKSPSFWVKWVTIVREYACVDGTPVPVRVESTADVRFAGVSRMLMTYDYESINGRPVRLRDDNRQLGPALLPASLSSSSSTTAGEDLQ